MPRLWKVVAFIHAEPQAWYDLNFEEANRLLDLLRNAGVDASLEPQDEPAVTSD